MCLEVEKKIIYFFSCLFKKRPPVCHTSCHTIAGVFFVCCCFVVLTPNWALPLYSAKAWLAPGSWSFRFFCLQEWHPCRHSWFFLREKDQTFLWGNSQSTQGIKNVPEVDIVLVDLLICKMHVLNLLICEMHVLSKWDKSFHMENNCEPTFC